MITTAHALYPTEKITSVGWDDDEPRFFVNIAPDFLPSTKESHTISFDAHTGERLEEVKDERGFMYVMLMLHMEMFAGLPGELLLGRNGCSVRCGTHLWCTGVWAIYAATRLRYRSQYIRATSALVRFT